MTFLYSYKYNEGLLDFEDFFSRSLLNQCINATLAHLTVDITKYFYIFALNISYKVGLLQIILHTNTHAVMINF